MKKYSNARFFVTWGLLFAAGVLILLYGSGAWPALGSLIVVPTILCVILMAWGYLVCKIIAACGGDPEGDSVGIVIFVSFAFLVLPLLVAYLSRRH
jgi:hypothetical protein